MLVIFVFHCARFFNHEGWHVKNDQLTGWATIMVMVLAQWIMPLFFVLSAISISASLQKRSLRGFIIERSRRLLVPLVFGSLVVIAPLQVWIERVVGGEFSGSFWSFYPHYFQGFYAFGGNFAWMGLHLWYLEVLFIFSLLLLPFFLSLQQRTYRIDALADFSGYRGGVLIMALPLIAVQLLVDLQPGGVGIRDFGGWALPVYLGFFINGYVVGLDMRFRLAMESERRLAAGLALLITCLALALYLSGIYRQLGAGISYLFWGSLLPFNSWCWLVAILGYGSRYLKGRNGVLEYASRAVLPFYILHQTVIVGLGFVMRSWPLDPGFKFILLAVVAFVLIMLIFEFFVRRITWLQPLFGMK